MQVAPMNEIPTPFPLLNQGRPPLEPLPTSCSPQFQCSVSRARLLGVPSCALTHPAVDLPSPPALLPLLVKDLDNVTLLEVQLRSVPGTEVVAYLGCAEILGAPCCVGESRGGRKARGRRRPTEQGQGEDTTLRRVMLG